MLRNLLVRVWRDQQTRNPCLFRTGVGWRYVASTDDGLITGWRPTRRQADIAALAAVTMREYP